MAIAAMASPGQPGGRADPALRHSSISQAACLDYAGASCASRGAMRFRISSELEYEVKSPSTLIFSIHALRTSTQTVLHESLTVDPYVKHEEFVSLRGDSRFVRFDTGKQESIKLSYAAEVDCEHAVVNASELEDAPVQHLDHSLITFLFPSRYCQSDMLGRLAWSKFGKIDNAYKRVMAVTDWIYENVEYVLGSTNAQTSAYDTVTQRAGVCRDFAHLGVALCRALNIPARYFTGYAYQLQPQDFHACFEAFIGNRWIVFDATRLAPLNGLVRIATGRDAADTAVATLFGQVQLKSLTVGCELLGEGFKPLTRKELGNKGVCLEPSA